MDLVRSWGKLGGRESSEEAVTMVQMGGDQGLS